MDIAPQLLDIPDFRLNPQQQQIVAHDEGPLLVIAGPGSGKTRSLILRAMNLLLLNKARPDQLILCTYTEKAANEMHQRFMTTAQQVGYHEDLSHLRIGTIHSTCNRLLTEYRHYTELGSDYRQLDQFAQRLFIFQRRKAIGHRDALGAFRDKWGTDWAVAKRLQEYFDKITEEMADIERLKNDREPFRRHLAFAYSAYRTLLMRENCVSFSALLQLTHALLENPHCQQKIIKSIKYILVDEYQDTNYIQEQILLKLASATGNLCVVGDEDQALYRFRGATVRNLLEFQGTVPNCTRVTLTTNYRSHKDIVSRYDSWMASFDWSNTGKKPPFRFEKNIQADSLRYHMRYPAVVTIQGQDALDEGRQFAQFVLFLKQQALIDDYSQVALLLHSVKPEYSDVYKNALLEKEIPAFCPRARAYFLREEVTLLIGCFAFICDYKGEEQGDFFYHEHFSRYLQEQCLSKLDTYTSSLSHPLTLLLRAIKDELHVLLEIEQDAPGLSGYFFRLLSVEPFTRFVQAEEQMHNLVIFSKVLATFEDFYRHPRITSHTLDALRRDFFGIFLRLLEEGGINEYEDAEQPFLPGHVQIMTIHQAKGLEFPVVVVGSLHEGHSGAQPIDRELHPFYRRKQFEPESRIPGFDMMRLYYVAFSRAERLLVLTGNMEKGKTPRKQFYPILDGLPQWSMVQSELLHTMRAQVKLHIPSKKRYSFTGHVQLYETCPRQYQYFREYEFKPARAREVFLGLLVHQVLEDIHKIVLHQGVGVLHEQMIRERLEKVYGWLLCSHEQPTDEMAVKGRAFTQVYNYVRQNLREMLRLIDSEVPISAEKNGYILTGRIDLLMRRDNSLELLDFKTGPRPRPDDACLIDYERQLYLYASVLQQQYKLPTTRLLLYWTEEVHKEDALMVFHYRPERAEHVRQTFESVVQKIKAKDFLVKTVPEEHVCLGCDIQHICLEGGLIKPSCCRDFSRD